MNSLTVVLMPFMAAIFSNVLCRWLGAKAHYVLAAVPTCIALWCLGELAVVRLQGAYVQTDVWVPSLSTNLSFLVDGLSLLFVLLISGIGSLIFIYGGAYLKGHLQFGRFFTILNVFMGAMLGTVLSNNIIVLFVFWEITSVASYLLIGFKHEKVKSRECALQALLVTGLGGLFMLFGFVLVGLEVGSYTITDIITKRELLINSPYLVPIVGLILMGAFTKSAQFPFHFWLPNAMEAPTPISAYLHSATMVKAGIFLIARLSPIFAGVTIWNQSVTVCGFTTFLLGAFLSLRTSDLKQILAYTTVSSLGVIVFLLGLGTEHAVVAAVVFLFGHALYKGALFMVAGIIDHSTNSRDIRELGGLYKPMPITAVIAVLAGLSMVGVPPLIGFTAKELIYESILLFSGRYGYFGIALTILGMAGIVAAAFVVVIKPFFMGSVESRLSLHDPTPALWLPPAILSALGVVAGISLGFLGGSVVNPAVGAIITTQSFPVLALWHGWNIVLLLSAVTVLAGVALFLVSGIIRASKATALLERIGPEAIYRFSLKSLTSIAAWQTRVIQSGYLRNYIIIVIFFTVTLLGITLIDSRLLLLDIDLFSKVCWHEVLLGAAMIFGCIDLICSKSRLGAVVALGVVGYCVALLFMLFSAPDLAMTQFAIETLAVILFVFVLYKLPNFSEISSAAAKSRDALLACSFGSVMALLVIVILTHLANDRVSSFYAEASYLLAKGRNVVNVIIVDFRALDTLGEIVVIVIAALGVHTMIRLRVTEKQEKE